jgi:hypothetical protein
MSSALLSIFQAKNANSKDAKLDFFGEISE